MSTEVSCEYFIVNKKCRTLQLMYAKDFENNALNNLMLISNSDAHSARNIGSEVNLLDTALSYDAIFNALKQSRVFYEPMNIFHKKASVLILVKIKY